MLLRTLYQLRQLPPKKQNHRLAELVGELEPGRISLSFSA